MRQRGHLCAGSVFKIITTIVFYVFAAAIQEKSLWRERLVGDYLQNSLWLSCDKSSKETVSLVAYIADGAVQSMKALDYDIEGTYPNNRS